MRPSRRPSNGWKSGGSSRPSATAASWTRSTSRIRSGLTIELASYRFEPPQGFTHTDVLFEAHKLKEASGGYNIDERHLADAIEALVERSRESLSDDRSPKNPYRQPTPK